MGLELCGVLLSITYFKMVLREKKPLSLFILLILSIIWGSSFILMHEGLKVFTSLQLASFRLGIIGLIFLPFGILSLKKVELKDMKWFAIAGLIGNFIPAFCFAHAQTYLQSSTAGILNSLTPLFTLLSGLLIFKKKYNLIKLSGILIGLIGALTLILSKPGGGIESNIIYGVLILLATLLYGINVNIIELKLSKYNPLYIAFISLTFLFVPSLFCMIYFDFPFGTMFSKTSLYATLCIMFLGIAGTGIGLILFNRLIQISNGLFASTVTYTMPIISSLWGIYFNENFGLIQILSLSLIFAGVLIVRKNNA